MQSLKSFLSNVYSCLLFCSITIRCCNNLFSTLGQKITTSCVSCCALTSPRALVVKEDPVDSKHVVGLSKVHHDPVGIELCSTWEERWRQTGTKDTRLTEDLLVPIWCTFPQTWRDITSHKTHSAQEDFSHSYDAFIHSQEKNCHTATSLQSNN